MNFFSRRITKDQSRDTGMAMVLLFLIFYFLRKREGFILGAAVLHVVNMTVPQVYRPVAVVWLGLSHLLGEVVSRVLLSVVFFVIVTPVGMVRRLFGKDSLKLKTFRAGEESVMTERNHTYRGSDLDRPY